jgi:hypothetical protein
VLACVSACLISTAAALGDAPTIRITKADQAKATAALLHRSDVGAGWTGGAVKASPLTPPKCPGFDPKESDLTVTGHADARFTFAAAGVELDQDVQVLKSASAVLLDFRRTISSKLASCLQLQLTKLSNVKAATVTRVSFPPTGAVSAVYRAMIDVKHGTQTGKLISDYVFFGEGRFEYEFTIVAPVGTRSQLARFESGLAAILLKRAGIVSA